MLLKFTTVDMLNTALIDVSTGQRVYDIATILLPPPSEAEKEVASVASAEESPVASSSSQECRHTSITDSSGNSIVSISWSGRHPDITILDEKIGGLTDLFGSTTVRFMYDDSSFFSSQVSQFNCPSVGPKSSRSQRGSIQNIYGPQPPIH